MTKSPRYVYLCILVTNDKHRHQAQALAPKHPAAPALLHLRRILILILQSRSIPTSSLPPLFSLSASALSALSFLSVSQPYMPAPAAAAAAAASDALARNHAQGRRSSPHHPSPFLHVRS